jgi:GNAT superfamily N-acetyltransferase
MAIPVSITAHPLGPNTAYIEWFAVPKGHRGKGVGTQAYEEWERALPPGITTIRLHAADSGEGPSGPFWESLGFEYRWDEDEIDDAVAEGADRIELEQEMVKSRTLF